MFVDKVTVQVQAGNGGNGVVSWRHEKFVDKGGPDGGDGGKGGDVVFRAEHNESSLAKFRYNPTLVAENGVNGAKQKKRGASGKDVVVTVPVGTVIYQGERVLADLANEAESEVIAKGGKGGFGNAHFVSSVRQVPKVAEIGEKGDKFELTLELKMLADVGLVGLPNAGKSTFLSVVTNAKPEIADYPFTTLIPNLGVADVDNQSLLIADIPGLIEGASQGKGLGDEFLRHVERTQVLLHIIDATSNNIAQDYEVIQKELQEYAVNLSEKPQLVVLSKTDALDDELLAMQMEMLKSVLPKRQRVLTMSAKNPNSVQKVLRELIKVVTKTRAKQAPVVTETKTLPTYALTGQAGWQINKTELGFVVVGTEIERFANRTDFSSEAGVARLRDILRRKGVFHELERSGAKPGEKVIIGNATLTF